MSDKKTRLRLAVSGCLLGEKIRYDGSAAADRFVINQLGRHFELVSFCPEMGIGLGSPRPAINLYGAGARARAVVEDDLKSDLTGRFFAYSKNVLASLADTSGFVFKHRSPSCAVTDAKIIGKNKNINGPGIFARMVMNLGSMPVIDERTLASLKLRDHFLEKVYLRGQWLECCRTAGGADALAEFQNSMQIVVASRGREAAGRWRELHVSRGKRGWERMLTELMKLVDHTASGSGLVLAMKMTSRELCKRAPGVEARRIDNIVSRFEKGQTPLHEALDAMKPLTCKSDHGNPARMFIDSQLAWASMRTMG